MLIAVIGGIGSGKSEVLKVAKRLGFSTLSADTVNAELQLDTDYIFKIARPFPSAVKDGKIDKSELARQAFSTKENRLKLNSVSHPEILKKIREEAYVAEKDGKRVVIEVPLFLESGMRELFDHVILIAAPLLKRIKLLKIRGLSCTRAFKIISVQTPFIKLKKYATVIIKNTGSLADLQDSAEELFSNFKT